MTFRPGSFPWHVAHDLRLSRLQAAFGDRGALASGLIVLGVLLAFHLLAIPLGRWILDAHSAPQIEAGLASVTLFVLPWLVSQSLTGFTRSLYSRGDLDLLLSSPANVRAVAAAKGLGVCIETLLSLGIFAFPLADSLAILSGPRWLAVYPALMAAALLATALGLALTVAMFALVGARRTRMLSQVVSTLIASGFILATQIVHVLPDGLRDRILAQVLPDGSLPHFGPVWWPVRAILGDPVAILLWAGLAMLAFLVSVVLLGPGFLRQVLNSAGDAGDARPRQRDAVARFRGGIGRSLRRKEWRLLVREPQLSPQLLLQIIYTLPMTVVVWRSQAAGGSIALAAVPSIVVIASQVAASLAWLAVSSEDAPEFLMTAPVKAGVLQRRKLESVVLPVAVLMSPFVLGLI